MSEGPPKKPEQPAESAPQVDTQTVFIHVRMVVAELNQLTLSGDARRALQTLTAVDTSLETLIAADVRSGNAMQEGDKNVGPLFIMYIRALETVVGDDGIWNSLAQKNGSEYADLQRKLLQKDLSDLESVQIEQFNFPESKQ